MDIRMSTPAEDAAWLAELERRTPELAPTIDPDSGDADFERIPGTWSDSRSWGPLPGVYASPELDAAMIEWVIAHS